ncbi:MAG: type II secretion system protein GspD [Limisphaerales bacterium]
MKIKSGLFLALLLAATPTVGSAQEAQTTPAATSQEVMPLIVIDDAPLPDAIRNLARQAGINVLFDPRAQATMTNNVSFRLENITAEQAMQAVLDNNGYQLVHDPRTRISRVTIKDPAALEPLVPRVMSLKYSHPTNVLAMVQANFTSNRSRVLADPRTSQLLVLATEDEHVRIQEMIEKLDVSPEQILIEARFIETAKNPSTAKGINWSRTLENQRFTFGNNFSPGIAAGDNPGVVPPSPITPVPANPVAGLVPGPESTAPRLYMSTAGFHPAIAFLNADGVNAALSFFNSDNQSETIATPRAVALEGVPTELSVVRNVPVLEEEQGANVGGAQQASTVRANYAISVRDTIINEVGVKLVVTPRIYGGTNVFLNLQPEISQQGVNQRQTLSGRISEAPTFERRRINTQAMVPSGTTLVLGGLTQDATTKSGTKVPLLGDIPGVGKAFRSNAKSQNKSHLLIFVTPTILNVGDYLPSPEAREFLNQKPIDKPDVPWSAWDSAEPKDWSSSVD